MKMERSTARAGATIGLALFALLSSGTAAFVAKEPPDLFMPSGKLSFTYLRTRGMILPLTEVAPTEAELKGWMEKFPPLLRRFVEGSTVFNGKPYIIDLSGQNDAYPGFPLYYNKTLFRGAGTGQPPATYSELRQAAANVTAAGQGKSFGISHGLRYRPGAWQQDVAYSLAKAGGALGTGVTEWGSIHAMDDSTPRARSS